MLIKIQYSVPPLPLPNPVAVRWADLRQFGDSFKWSEKLNVGTQHTYCFNFDCKVPTFPVKILRLDFFSLIQRGQWNWGAGGQICSPTPSQFWLISQSNSNHKKQIMPTTLLLAPLQIFRPSDGSAQYIEMAQVLNWSCFFELPKMVNLMKTSCMKRWQHSAHHLDLKLEPCYYSYFQVAVHTTMC